MAKRKRRAPDISGQCPCGAGGCYEGCCRPLHAGSATAATAEQVMRARYTAHVFDDLDYLRRSWHPDTVPDHISTSDTSQRWLGLEVLGVDNGGALDAEGFVEFTARFELGTQLRVLHERSRFVRLNGQWIYYDGEIRF